MSDDGDFAARWRDAHGATATREVLCDAAHALIRREGLDALNMRALAATVGVSPMAPYKYFPAKESLVAEVRARVRSGFAAHLQQAAVCANEPADRLHRLCTAYVGFAVRNEQEYRLIFLTRGSAVESDDRGTTPAWTVLLDALQQMGDHRSAVDALDEAHLIWATLHGLVMLHLSDRLGFGRSVEELGRSSSRFLLNALRLP
ncbi:transcriptional regulator, TetR family [Sphingomonas guangdongensis]|uniref:Transcriptional regulator, TetR family n=1 Tax=Sphingomonas guangdongensis TaxID=1141890 RepID=A0A285QB93_9SPHN|nr:TetR/AcrR family transcriptional regulator [Sphingomonas guangdongensis]SOB79106.1 transcriptional regulator, TetR family [Sphingomonas guangdongensis]